MAFSSAFFQRNFVGGLFLASLLQFISLRISWVSIQLFSPNQPCLLTLIDHRLEETTKRLDSLACADARQAGMIRQGLVEIIAKIPQDA